MKHKLSLMLIVFIVICLMMLSACQGGSAGSNTTTSTGGSTATPGQTQAPTAAEQEKLTVEMGVQLEFSYWEGSASDKTGFDYVLQKFTQNHPEITLNPQIYPSNTYAQQLDTRIAANDWPDVMRYKYQNLGKFKESGVMLELTGSILEENLTDLVPAYRSALTFEGRLLGMPHHTDTIAIYYNKAMFEKSGIRIPKDVNDGWTWDELTEIARKLKADHGLNYVFGGIWENGSGYRYLPFVYAGGGAILSEDMKSIAINSPEALNAIKLYETWRKEDLVVKTGFTQQAQTNMLFVAEKTAFTFSGSWHCSYMEENMKGKWGVTYMPRSVDGKSGSDMGGNGLFAASVTKAPKASAIFIEYLTSKENMKEFCEKANFIPVRTSLINEGLKYSSFPVEMDVFLDIVSTIDPKMAEDETSTRFQKLNVIFSEEMDPLAIDGSATAEKVIENCEKRMTEVLMD